MQRSKIISKFVKLPISYQRKYSKQSIQSTKKWITNSFVNSAFDALCQAAKAQISELQKYNCARALSDSDEERHSTHPIYDTFLKSIQNPEND